MEYPKKKYEKNKPKQKDMFDEIWAERAHLSEVSGVSLLPKGNPMWHWQFSHILTKGAFPAFKCNKENIVLMLPDEHILWENHKHKLRDNDKWKWIFDLEQALKEKYFALR